MIYLIGSLRNPKITEIAQRIQEQTGQEVFASWFAASRDADDAWKEYEQGRGHSYVQALHGWAAHHVFDFDRAHLHRADTVVLILPAGKSGHLELGWALGKGKLGYIVLEEGADPRWDVMYLFADGVYESVDQLLEVL